MKNGISIKLTASMKNFAIIEAAMLHLGKKQGYPTDDLKTLIKATRELVKNIVEHAYEGEEGLMEITLHGFDHSIRVDVRDWGIPMTRQEFKSPDSKGFQRIRELVEHFAFKNLGKAGKVFTLIKQSTKPRALYTLPSKPKKKIDKENLVVKTREFHDGDEKQIASLIYRNYGLSYGKEDFYYPNLIREKQGTDYVSIVAEADGKVVGHFALILMPTSNIAEIGVVVVDPDYKGMGIMNKMFEHLLYRAREIGLSAVFGQAVMYHIYSQKSNLTHHFCETALILGHSASDMRIENNKLTERARRGADLASYYFFERYEADLYLPRRYAEQILRSYENCQIPFRLSKGTSKEPIPKHAHLDYSYNPVANIGTIMVHRYGKDFKFKFILLLEQLRAKHCDMIYADINLEKIPQIDRVIKTLNDRVFFYSGVLFQRYYNHNYLRLQHKHSIKIGKKNLICYSPYCRSLLEYIRHDEKSIKRNLKKERGEL
jgi:N-acetylglutamate synthase-like GNAT family acetyltransferase/anti-sigma regulatory factor (Ser/Thr protein kinase)